MITSDMYYGSAPKGIEYWPLIDQTSFLTGVLISIDGCGVCEVWPYHEVNWRINELD